MAEYSRIAKGHFTSTGSAQVVNLPFQPDYVELINYTVANSAATSQAIARAYWDATTPVGGSFATIIEGYNATPALIFDTITSGGISTFGAGLALQYGALKLLGASGGAGIAKTSATVLTVTTATAHGLQAGNWVTFQNLYQTATTGMQQIAGISFEVQTVTSPTVFTISWVGNSSNLTAITTTATGAAGFKQILYPTLYAPGVAIPWAITQSNGLVTVTTTAPHNFQVGQQIGFRIPTAWGANELNELPNTLIPSSPQYYYVVSATRNSFTFNYSGPLTAYTVNQTFASFPGLKFPNVFAVGDINSGGTLYTGGNLYPSPLLYNGYTQTQASTINGSAISGAFVNNTSQGFIVGGGAGTVLTTASLVGANGNVIMWRAYLSDLAVN